MYRNGLEGINTLFSWGGGEGGDRSTGGSYGVRMLTKVRNRWQRRRVFTKHVSGLHVPARCQSLNRGRVLNDTAFDRRPEGVEERERERERIIEQAQGTPHN